MLEGLDDSFIIIGVVGVVETAACRFLTTSNKFSYAAGQL
jgi:hypothetical protein